MNLAKHVLIASGLLTCTIAARLTSPNYYNRDLKAVAGKATLRRAEQVESSWKARAYTSLGSNGVEEAFLARFNWTSLDIDEIQKVRLKTRVQELFRYFRHPQFQEYYRLKTEGLHYYFSPSAGASNLVASALAEKSVVGLPGAEEFSQLLWNVVHKQHGSTVLPQLTAVSLDSVIAAISRTNSGPALLAGAAKNGFTIGVEAFDPGFRYEIATNSQSGPLLFEFSFLAQTKGSDAVGPLHISLVWVERDKIWALNRLIVDNWLRVSTLF